MASAISGTVSAYLHAKKRVVVEDGGPQISNPLITGLNPNVTSMQYYDTVPVNQTNEFVTVNHFMSRVVGSLIISDQEEDENQDERRSSRSSRARSWLSTSQYLASSPLIILRLALALILTVSVILYLLILLLAR